MSTQNLKGKVALVTGASGGIGSAIAEGLAARSNLPTSPDFGDGGKTNETDTKF